MATCVHCGKSKGKRACPALGGEICPACCGKYRLVEIACPADCKWLGGLAALRSEAPVTFTADDERAAIRALIAFTETARELDESRAAFCVMLGIRRTTDADSVGAILAELGDASAAAATAYVAFGHVGEGGTRAVDRFLTSHGRDLSRGQASALVALQRARGLLVDLHTSQAGVGMVFRDRLTGAFVTVTSAPTEDVVGAGAVAYTWLIENAGRSTTVGPVIVIPPECVAAVEARLREAIATATAAGATADQLRLVLAAAAPLVLAALRDATPPPAAAEPPAAAAAEPAAT